MAAAVEGDDVAPEGGEYDVLGAVAVDVGKGGGVLDALLVVPVDLLDLIKGFLLMTQLWRVFKGYISLRHSDLRRHENWFLRLKSSLETGFHADIGRHAD